jgi:MoxR-like ATPase
MGEELLIRSLSDKFGENSDVSKKHDDSSPPWRTVFRNPENYLVNKELDRAAYVALLLGQPLLLTGEPGAGKSDFARKLAHVFNLGDVEEAHVKTTTVGRDLLYSFDDIGRFRDATDKDRTHSHPLRKYVRFNGLGRAILRSAGPDEEIVLVGRDIVEVLGRDLADGEVLTLGTLFPLEFLIANGRADPKPITDRRRCVVLIDEIDKAQRDTPNDLLDEIERMRFEIPELGISISSSSTHWPIVVITSNAERVLPAPFLRRCVFHRLVTPDDRRTLEAIVAARMSESFSKSPAFDEALAIFMELRNNPGARPPGLSELLAWLLLLDRMGVMKGGSLPKKGEGLDLVEASLSALSKTDVDFDAAKFAFGKWKSGELVVARN